MNGIGRKLERLSHNWTTGAAVLAVIALMAVAYGFVAALLVLFLGWLIYPAMSEAVFMDWLMVSAIVWLPLAACSAERVLYTNIRRDRQYRAQEREVQTVRVRGNP